MRLLLLSNSTIPGMGYLEYALDDIRNFLGNDVKKIAFVPFAGVTITWDDYEKKVADVFARLGYEIFSFHRSDDYRKTLEKSDAIAVGGGNTFKLVHDLHGSGLMKLIAEYVRKGMPYMGWSAGSNVACPSMRTTNDMPIIEPPDFKTLDLVPFQINPHYLDKNPEGHGGETREDRIREFIELNRHIYVVGLREGTLLRREGDRLDLVGNRPARIFHYGKEPVEVEPGSDLSYLLSQ